MDKFIADKSVDPIMAATRAMVVCEQAYTRRLVADVLYGMGIGAVALFDQPKRALESMAQFRPTLLVANWDAPSQDGLDLAKLVRSAAKSPTIRIPDPTIPIILVGCQQWLRDVNEAERAGVNEYLVKPFSISDLVPAIEVAVSRFQEIAQLEREVATLGDRLETRKIIERAKGLLQAKHSMTEPEAFTWMQRAAMDQRTTMKRVAEVVLETLTAPAEPPSSQ